MASPLISRRVALLLGLFLVQGVAFAMANSHLIFLGTYTRSVSKGIYAVRLDAATGALGEPMLVAEAKNPSWIELSPDKRFLYANHASEAQAIGFSVHVGADGKPTLTPLPTGELTTRPASGPSHLAVDATQRTLLAANYADGFVAALPIGADGTLGPPRITRHTGPTGPNQERQTKAFAHSVTVSPDNRYVIACDLGLDRVYSYALDPAAAELRPGPVPFVATEPGAGPRHFKFGVTGRHAYAINELNNTIAVYRYDAARGALFPEQTIPTLPAGHAAPNTTAEVRVHPNGRFLYGSNRGHDSIAVYAIDPKTGLLTYLERVPSGGKNPRNFALSPDGRWLVCGHQDTEILTVFRVDAETGRLMRTEHSAKVPMCVSVLFHS